MPVETLHMLPVSMTVCMLLVKRVTPPQALPNTELSIEYRSKFVRLWSRSMQLYIPIGDAHRCGLPADVKRTV